MMAKATTATTTDEIELLEYSLFSAVIYTPECLSKVAPALMGYKFHDPVLDWLWNIIRTHYNKNNEVPDARTLGASMVMLTEEQRAVAVSHFNTIAETEPALSPKSAVDTLRKRVEQLQLADTAEKLAVAAHSGDVEGGKAILARSKIAIVAATAPKGRALIHPNYKPDLAPRIPTGFYALDLQVHGLARQENGLILATTGKGKSVAAVNLGYHGVLNRRKVIHIDTENGEHVTRARYISRFTGIPANNILNNSMHPEQQEYYDAWVARNWERLAKYLHVVYLNFFESKLDEVRASIEEEIREGFTPDQIIFDSPDHVRREKKESTWVEFADLIIEAASIPRKYNCTQWITSQAGMEFEDKIISTRGAANTSEKMRMASIAMSINYQMDKKTGRPKKDESLMLYLGKARNSKRGMSFPLQCDLSRMVMDCPVMTVDDDDDDDEQPHVPKRRDDDGGRR